MKKFSTATLLAILPLILIGCNVITSSIEVKDRPDGNQVYACESALGAYSLAYSTIKISVFQPYVKVKNVPEGSPSIHIGNPIAHPDRDKKFCMDFRESPYSNDTIKIVWSGNGDAEAAPASNRTTSPTPNGLLALVISKNIDQTGEIIRRIIRAFFIAISGNASNGFGRSISAESHENRLMTEQDVDPFNLKALAKLNKTITDYGFCITLGDYTYETSRLSIDEYCDDPDRSTTKKNMSRRAKIVGNQNFLRKKTPKGIYYRPKQNYSLFVYVRDDPDIPTEWQLRKIETVSLENISPIIGIGVTRAMFAEHKLLLAFDNGNLLTYCLAKGSEVAGAIQIPLDIIYGIVSLPAATISAEIGLANQKVDLLNAQQKLITAQNAYIDYLTNPENTSADKQTSVGGLTADNFSFGKNSPESPSAVSTAKVSAATGLCNRLKL